MSAITPFVQQVKRRADELAMREHGLFPCINCREPTDNRNSAEEFCCEDCCEFNAMEMRAEARYNDNRRF